MVETSFHTYFDGFPVAQLVEHGASNAKIMGSIPRESKTCRNVKKNCNLNVSRFG